MNKLITDNLGAIKALCRAHHIMRLYVFGSVTTQEFNEQSDIDFLYEPDYTGFNFDIAASYPYDPIDEFFSLKEGLQALLGRRVDLIPNQTFQNPYFNKTVQSSRRLLFQDERHKEVSR